MAGQIHRILPAFAIDHSADGSSALETMRATGNAYDVVVVRWDLPKMQASRMLAELSASGIAVPAIILIDEYCILYEETALSLGAADVVALSRGVRILARRIALAAESTRSRLQIAEREDTATFGELALRPDSCRAFWRDRQVPLTLTEYNIVDLLARNSPNCLSFREIYDVVHGAGFAAGDGSEGYRLNVRTLIKRIRRKFCEVAAQFDEIETLPGAGYRWRSPGN